MAPQLLAASARLDNLVDGFEIEDIAVFDVYCTLDMLHEYTTDVVVEVNNWMNYIRSIVSKYHVQPAPPPRFVDASDPHVTQTCVSADYLKFHYLNSTVTYTSGLHSVISFSLSCRNSRAYLISSGFIICAAAFTEALPTLSVAY